MFLIKVKTSICVVLRSDAAYSAGAAVSERKRARAEAGAGQRSPVPDQDSRDRGG